MKTGIATEVPENAEQTTSPVDDDDDDVEIITEHVNSNDSQAYKDPNVGPSNGNFNGFNGISGMNQTNGMLPVEFSSMMAANGMMSMAGMPNMMGMGMMPMLSQMFGGFDNSNMGMNGMHMGMVNGGGYQSQNQYSNGGSWMNNNQGNFNNNAYGNVGFGASTGYSMSAHQNNYNQMNEQAYANNDFQRGYGRQGFQNRRGRRGYYNGGGFGRGNYYQGNNQFAHTNPEQLYPQHDAQNSQGENGQNQNDSNSLSEARKTALNESSAPGGKHDVDNETERTKDDVELPKHEENGTASVWPYVKDIITAKSSENVHSKHESGQDVDVIPDQEKSLAKESKAETSNIEDQSPRPIQAYVSNESRPQYVSQLDLNIPTGPATKDFARQLSESGPLPIPVNAPIEPRGVGVAGAPTGPRALREGLPNTSRSTFRPTQTNEPSIVAMSNRTGFQSSKGPTAVEESDQPPSPSDSRSRSRSPEKHDRYHEKPARLRGHSPDIKDEEYSTSRSGHLRRHKDQAVDEEVLQDRSPRISHSTQGNDDRHREDYRKSSHKSRHRREDAYPIEDENRYSNKHPHREVDHQDRVAEEDHKRSSKRSRRHQDDDDKSSSRRRYREESRSPHHRSSRKNKHRSHEEYGDDYREETVQQAIPKQVSQLPEISKHHEERSSRKRRSHEIDSSEYQVEHHDRERKRSRHEQSPTQSVHFSVRGTSQSNASIASTFPPTSHSSCHTSKYKNGNSHHPASPSKSVIPTGPRSGAPSKPTSHRHHNRDQHRTNSGSTPIPDPEPKPKPKPTEKDVHTLEREARDRERLQREMQRRAFIDVGSKRKNSALITSSTSHAPSSMGVNGLNGMNGNGRKMSYKYEDEGGIDARRIEREREAGRWR